MPILSALLIEQSVPLRKVDLLLLPPLPARQSSAQVIGNKKELCSSPLAWHTAGKFNSERTGKSNEDFGDKQIR